MLGRRWPVVSPKGGQGHAAQTPGVVSLSLVMEGIITIPHHPTPSKNAKQMKAQLKMGTIVTDSHGKQETNILKTISLILYVLKIMMSQQ